jgi:3-oxoacid CoA-transferase A subunit
VKPIYTNTKAAIADIPSGAVVAVGGFFSAGVPRMLLRALKEMDVKDLTMACGSGPLLGAIEEGSALLEGDHVKCVIDSYALPRSISKGQTNLLEQKVRSGRLELIVYPMGTLAEKYRAAGAGIPAFFVKTGAGTVVEQSVVTNLDENAQPKETKVINGTTCVLEYALQPDFALIHAYRADMDGNLQYRKTARNFNHVMAMAAKITIAEVEEIVEPGQIEPDAIHTPGIFVQRLVKVPRLEYTCGID